jgi:hypothetical protein
MSLKPRLHWLVALALLLAFVQTMPAQAQKRVGLVIGNSAYQATPALTNPKNDAADFAALLKAERFEVVEGFDLTKAAMDRKIAEFAGRLTGADVGVFFYAGHGLQVGGQNYLVPIDAQLTTAAALDFEMVRLDLVQRTMERETNTNILFLDACRDNPLTRNLARAMGTRSVEIGRGLAAVQSGVGTLISYSTQPGNVALDGAGRNSPFAGALVKRVKAGAKRDLSAILIDVRNDVMHATRNKQVPWEHSALRARFYFTPPAPPPPQKVAVRDAAPTPTSTLTPSPAIATRLYDSLMRRILAQKLKGNIVPSDEGKDNPYRHANINPMKAMAACIDWEKSTPHRLEQRGYSFASGEKTQIDADERALSQCYRVTNGCQCAIIDRSNTNTIVFPPAWVEKHKQALR